MDSKHRKHTCKFIIFLFFTLTLPINLVFANAPAKTLVEEIDSYLGENKSEIAGLTTILIEGDDVQYRMKGYANIANELTVDEHTVFEWGSISKLLIWVSVFQLVEKEIVNLDTDIGMYLPGDFQVKRQFSEPITLRDLMNHSAGFADSYTDLFVHDSSEVPPIRNVLESANITQVFSPGEIVAYSNYGASLAAYVVQEVSGLDYRDYVREHIFEPLVMKKTAIDPLQDDNEWVRRQREHIEGYTDDLQLIDSNRMFIPMYPAGSVVGTATDLQKLLQALLSEDGAPLFQDEHTIEKFFEISLFYSKSNIPRMANGLFSLPSDAGKVLGHGGNTIAFSSSIYLDREKDIGVIVLTNKANETTFTLGIPEVVFGEYEYETNKADLEDARKWTGMYESARAPADGFSKVYRLFLRSKAEQVNTYDIIMNGAYYSQIEPGVFVTKDDFTAYALDVYTEHPNHKKVLASANTDLLYLPYYKHYLEWVGIILVAISMLFSVGFIIASFVKKFRRRRVAKVLLIQHSLHLLLFVNVLSIIYKTLSMTTYLAVKPFLIANILYLIVSLILTGIVFFQIKSDKSRLLTRFATIVSTIIICVNVIYWDFYF